MIRSLGCLLAASFLNAVAIHCAQAQENAEPEAPALVIGYIELAEDERYRRDSAYTGIVYRSLGRPYPGAELGIEDAQVVGRVTGRSLGLKRQSGDTTKELVETVSHWAEEDDINFVIADLPGPELIRVADSISDLPVLLMNVSASEDSLRGGDCRGNIVHFIPSAGMLADALVQHLVVKQWTDVLILQGPGEADARKVEAMRRSAAKFGARIVEVKPFSLGTDPRQRDENNVALATAGIDADVVYVADTSGEFARYVPYQTASPMPVVGDAGLSPTAWHWSWYRHGAPQLQHRFEDLAAPRRMNAPAWAAWAAVKAVMQASMRSDSFEFESMSQFIVGPDMKLDGSKGNPMSVRAWDQQLRQPILLATADAVIARAPMPEFLHRTDVLDTLGMDAPESECRLRDEGGTRVDQ